MNNRSSSISNTNNRSSSISKWAIAAITAVITGVLVWLLTTNGGLLSRPDLKVLDVNVAPGRIGQPLTAQVRINNQGSTAAQRCQVQWQFAGGMVAAHSSSFGLAPGESTTIDLTSVATEKAGLFPNNFQISCFGYSSDSFPIIVVVRSL